MATSLHDSDTRVASEADVSNGLGEARRVSSTDVVMLELLELLRCHICGDFLNDPTINTVPECGHTFCRKCIMDYTEGYVVEADHRSAGPIPASARTDPTFSKSGGKCSPAAHTDATPVPGVAPMANPQARVGPEPRKRYAFKASRSSYRPTLKCPICFLPAMGCTLKPNKPLSRWITAMLDLVTQGTNELMVVSASPLTHCATTTAPIQPSSVAPVVVAHPLLLAGIRPPSGATIGGSPTGKRPRSPSQAPQP